ncbi:DUF6924 domain-containing protein [Streptomyces sp. NPDC090080]|uniref:DUF6924 domain-containing protein n=1 Tax=Streptomyces sp. NPDC090080 TaxID=3365939 RepID=UPI0037FE1DAD
MLQDWIPLIRTDFDAPEPWAQFLRVINPEDDILAARVNLIEDQDLSEAPLEAVLAAVSTSLTERPEVMFVVDSETLSSVDFPVLIVDLSNLLENPFRSAAAVLYEISSNVLVGNMSVAEFRDKSHNWPDGIYRGFPNRLTNTEQEAILRNIFGTLPD